MVCECPLETYLDEWEQFHQNDQSDFPGYLKDWHFVSETGDGSMYEVPDVLGEDWMNPYCDWVKCQGESTVYNTEGGAQKNFRGYRQGFRGFGAGGDYRFVYMGPKGTGTGLHVDVFGSHSWSANVVGRKRWVFFCPADEAFLHDRFGNVPPDVNSVDATQFPKFQLARPIECFQNRGEVMFVPSGWYHQVWNVQNTISINHNWCNGCNIDLMFERLKREYEATVRGLEDCRAQLQADGEWVQTIEHILFCSGGWNVRIFVDFLNFVMEHIVEKKRTTDPVRFEFDRQQIDYILEKCNELDVAKSIF